MISMNCVGTDRHPDVQLSWRTDELGESNTHHWLNVGLQIIIKSERQKHLGMQIMTQNKKPLLWKTREEKQEVLQLKMRPL